MSTEKLLTVKELNWGEIRYPSDDWVAITRVVHTNGTVQTHVQRTLSGMIYSGVNGISEENFEKLKDLLTNFELRKGENDRTVHDGIGYEITLHATTNKTSINEDTEESEIRYVGYIYNNSYLQSIIKLVCAH